MRKITKFNILISTLTTIWTSSWLYYFKVIKKDYESFCFVLGITLISVSVGSIVLFSALKISNSFFFFNLDQVTSLVDSDLNKLENLQDPQIDKTTISESEKLEVHKKKLKNWLLFGFLIYYFLAQL